MIDPGDQGENWLKFGILDKARVPITMANTEEQTNYKKQLDRAATGESETVVESANKLVDTVIDKGMCQRSNVLEAVSTGCPRGHRCLKPDALTSQ